MMNCLVELVLEVIFIGVEASCGGCVGNEWNEQMRSLWLFSKANEEEMAVEKIITSR